MKSNFLDWKKVSLGEAFTFQRGFDITKDQQMPGPYPVFSSSGPKSIHAKFMFEGPGVIIGRKGTLGSVFFSKGPYWPHDTTLWVKDFHGNDPKFAFYFLQTMGFERLDAGASNPTLNRNHIHTIQIFLPNISIQQQIAEMLSAYDDLIEDDRRRIKILEEMACSLYRKWFVYFRYPGHESIPLVNSPLGPIPKGWEVKCLGDIGNFRNGINYLRNDSGDAEYYIANVRDISHDKILLTECFDKIFINSSKAKEFLLEKTDILIARSACPGEASLIVPHVENVIFSGFTIRFRMSEPENMFYMFNVLLGLRKMLSNFSTGTAMKSVNQETLRKTKVLYPNNILSEFKKVIEPLYAQIIILMKKNNNLAKTRDLLLPRLISGQIELDGKVPIA